MEFYKKKDMKAQHIAGGFSAKEAVLKALGTGLRGFRWKDVEILRGSIGKPIVRFSGNVKQFVEDNGIGIVHVTISHSKEFATATAIAEVSMEREGMVIGDLFFQIHEDARKNIH
jgi:holo-[acyl-carrier protein] synthase